MKNENITRTIITPEMAADLLKLNSFNRPLSKSHVNKLANAIKKGEWEYCGDSIKISSENTLLDGQHRLHAIIQANIPVETLIIRELPSKTFHVIDTGKKGRGTADVLAIAGEKNQNVLAAMVCMLIEYENSNDFTVRSVRPSATEVAAYIDQHPEVRDFANTRPGVHKLTTPSIAAVLTYLFSKVDKQKCDQFMERLATGVGLEQNNPILQVRELLIQNRHATKKFSKKIVAAIVIKAFNYYRSGKSIARIRYSNDERFPEIDGINKKKKDKK